MNAQRTGLAAAFALVVPVLGWAAGVSAAYALTALALAPTAQAAPSAQAQREIEALIDGLGDSGCRFERNGSWYDATAARAHLKKKYDYLRKRELADTAELFIERAASHSSMSGKPYRVSCPGEAVVESAVWFQRALRKLRAGPVAPKPAAPKATAPKPAASTPAVSKPAVSKPTEPKANVPKPTVPKPAS